MKCIIDGCENDVLIYKNKVLCQKHYIRFYRYGTYDLTRIGKKKYRLVNPSGYQRILVGEHCLPTHNGYIYEHRKVVFDMYGVNLPDCELCGKATIWETCVIDHKDNDVSNNSPENLRPVCDWCNTSRGVRKEAYAYYPDTSITLDGNTMTANEWSRQPGVKVCGGTIIKRKRDGASDYDAIYGEKKTHNGSMTKDAQRKREKAKKQKTSDTIL
jgi:hypothetical protein